MYIQIFETNILRLLEEQGMTKLQLAEKANISISFLSDLTHGKANPSLKIMESIADAFEVPLAYLLESTELTPEQLAELRDDASLTRRSAASDVDNPLATADAAGADGDGDAEFMGDLRRSPMQGACR